MKDKRIFIQSFKNRPCVDCPAASSVKNCTCPDLHRFSHGINKSEAIEKMAKVMCYNHSRYNVWKNCDDKSCDKCRYYIDWLHYAKAALKALLEDK